MADSATESQARVVLWGLPGMGKTRLAFQFLQTYQDSYDVIIWIDASSPENAQSFFDEAATEIRLSRIDPAPADLFSMRHVVTWLETSHLGRVEFLT